MIEHDQMLPLTAVLPEDTIAQPAPLLLDEQAGSVASAPAPLPDQTVSVMPVPMPMPDQTTGDPLMSTPQPGQVVSAQPAPLPRPPALAAIPDNTALLIGPLTTLRDGRKELPLVARMNGMRGTVSRFAIEGRSSLGDPFRITLDLGPGATGAELLTAERVGQPLAVEGELQLRRDYDPRFAQDADDPGRETRVLKLIVRRVRELTPDEPTSGSGVWLRGTVLEPPRLERHPQVPSVELAMLRLGVVLARRSPMPGSQAVSYEQVEVLVGIPTTHPDASKLCRAGNVVRVEGQLDSHLATERAAEVTAAIAGLNARWAEQRATLEQRGATEQLEKAERTHRRAVRQLRERTRLLVLVGYVELLEGEEVLPEEGRRERRVWAREIQRRRRRGRVGTEAEE